MKKGNIKIVISLFIAAIIMWSILIIGTMDNLHLLEKVAEVCVKTEGHAGYILIVPFIMIILTAIIVTLLNNKNAKTFGKIFLAISFLWFIVAVVVVFKLGTPVKAPIEEYKKVVDITSIALKVFGVLLVGVLVKNYFNKKLKK